MEFMVEDLCEYDDRLEGVQANEQHEPVCPRLEPHEQQSFNNDVEMEEVPEENSKVKLKYMESENVLRAEYREIICTKETQQTTLVILNKQNSSLLEEIDIVQKDIIHVKSEYEFKNKKVAFSNEEVQQLMLRIEKNREILNRLETFLGMIRNDYNDLIQRNVVIQEGQHRMIAYKDELMKAKLKLSQSKSMLHDMNQSLEGEGESLIENQNTLLQQQIVQRQAHLDNLKDQCEDVKLKTENFSQLHKLNWDRQTRLQNAIQKLGRDQINLMQAKWVSKLKIENVERELEERNKRLRELIQQLQSCEDKITENKDAKESYDKAVESNPNYEIELNEELGKLRKCIEKKPLVLEERVQSLKEHSRPFEESLEKLKGELASLQSEYSSNKSSFETQKQQYISVLEEKYKLIQAKWESEKARNVQEVLKIKRDFLEERAIEKRGKNEELSEKLKQLDEDVTMQDLIKKRAYLVSCQDYLKEKVAGIQNRADVDIPEHKQLLERRDKLKTYIEERKRHVENLRSQLRNEDLQEIAKPPFPRNDPVAGILKPATPSKTNPISPKKVQFMGVSSNESSSYSSGSVPVKSNEDKLFDELLQNFQKQVPKTVAVKKRRIDLE